MNSYIGHPSQLSGVEEYRLIGGKGDGMRLLQVRNGLGLEFTVSPDRAADITRLSYEGVNYSYISPSGYVAPAYYDQQEFGFLKSFTCGFLTTCGLSNIGVPTEDESGKTGLHGTISHIPADHMLPYQMEKFSSRSLCSIGNWYVARRKTSCKSMTR